VAVVAGKSKSATLPPEARDALRAEIYANPDAFVQGVMQVLHMGDDKTPSGKLVDFTYNHDQLTIARLARSFSIRNEPWRILLGKARQRGVSTRQVYVNSVKTWSGNHRRSILVAHREDRATAFLDKIRGAIKELPDIFDFVKKTNHDSDFKMSWKEFDSIMWILSVYSANSIDMARGDTPHDIHGTEWTRWRNFVNTLTEVMSSCHMAAETSGLLESTLKGRGSEAHEFWLLSKKGKTIWTTLLLRWQDDPATHLNCHLWSKKEVEARLDEVLNCHPEYGRELIARGIRYKLSVGQVYQSYLWLKNVKNYLWDKFIEDFPLDDDEAWQAIGHLYFDENQIISIRSNISENMAKRYHIGLFELEGGFTPEDIDSRIRPDATIDEDTNEPILTIFEDPLPGYEYIVGGVSTSGNYSAMPSVSYVLNKFTGQCVAKFRGLIKPHQHGQIMSSLGKLFNMAVLAPEVKTAEGLATLAELSRLRYPRLYMWKHFDDNQGRTTNKLGWYTGEKGKGLTMNLVARVIEQASVGILPIHRKLIVDEGMIKELLTFIEDSDTGAIGAQANCDDTSIIAFAIAWYVADMETRGFGQGALDSLQPCQILTGDRKLGLSTAKSIKDAVAQAKASINKNVGTFHGQGTSQRYKYW
jgi:hypothetical protein